MEENKFEQLEEIETDLKVENTKKLMAYEELLIKEYNRSMLAKATNLINAGCFEQKEESTFDFTSYDYLKTEKSFKGYKLYQNKENKSLVLIYPLVENNKGDVDERHDLKPYAYDVIYVDNMDDETYKNVMKAAKNNLDPKLNILYKTSLIGYIVYLALFVINFIFSLIYTFDQGITGATILTNILSMNAIWIVGFALSTPVLALLIMKFRKYKDQ